MITSTIKTSGGTYSTIAGWAAGIAGTDDETGSCESSANLQSTELHLDDTGITGHTYLLTAAAANAIIAPTYAEVTSKARIEVDAPGLFHYACKVTGTWTIEKIGIVLTNGALCYVFGQAAAASVTVRRVGFCPTGNSQTGIAMQQSGTSTFSNCFYVGYTYGSDIVNVGAGTVTLYNCSFSSSQSPYRGVVRDGGTLNCYGVINYQAGSNSCFAGTIGGDYNASKDTTAPGTHSIKSLAASPYVNDGAGTQDLALNFVGDAPRCVVSRSGFPSDCDTDITGTTRPSANSDPGCWQSPTTTGIVLLNKTYRTGAGMKQMNTLDADLIVITLSDYVGTAAGFSDNDSQTWTSLTEKTAGPGGNSRARIRYKAAPTTRFDHQFTFTGGALESFEVMAFRGAHATPFDVENGSSNATQPGSITPSVNGCVIIVGLSADVTATVPTIDSGVTLVGSRGYSATISLQAAGGYKIQSTASAINPTWSDTGAAVIAAFKPSGGGGATESYYCWIIS